VARSGINVVRFSLASPSAVIAIAFIGTRTDPEVATRIVAEVMTPLVQVPTRFDLEDDVATAMMASLSMVALGGLAIAVAVFAG
jgi:hypothetical protein